MIGLAKLKIKTHETHKTELHKKIAAQKIHQNKLALQFERYAQEVTKFRKVVKLEL